MLRFDDSLIDLAAAYGGSEQKRGVLLNGEPWMLKLSDRLKENQLNSSYSNSAISEYVCCHIIELIGIGVQKTEIGYLHRWSDYHGRVIDDLVVACKNFVRDGWSLVEFKPLANTILPSKMGKIPKMSELNAVFSENVYFTSEFAKVARDRYWDTFVLDAFLGNFDRHGNNWGYLICRADRSIELAPIYDCGSCLFPQISDNGIEAVLQSKSEIERRVLEFPSAALLLEDGKKVNYYKFINRGDCLECNKALLRIVPKINLKKIKRFVNSLDFISEIRKEFYCTMLECRFNEILLPQFRKLHDGSKNMDCF